MDQNFDMDEETVTDQSGLGQNAVVDQIPAVQITVDHGDAVKADWQEEEECWLATYDLASCVVLAVICKQRGFLQHIDISENHPTEKSIMSLKPFGASYKKDYKDFRLFIVQPQQPLHSVELLNINCVREEFDSIVGERRVFTAGGRRSCTR